jgi:hypothetical protein
MGCPCQEGDGGDGADGLGDRKTVFEDFDGEAAGMPASVGRGAR